MSMMTTVSTKGQVTIPASAHERHGIKPGDRLIWEDGESAITMRKPIDFFSLRGCLSLGPNLPDDEEELLTPEMGRQIMERE